MAKKHGMEALALTDNGNLYGAIEFYKECKKAGLKPIIGVDAYLATRSLHDKQTGVDKERYRLVLLAKNEVGYKNLLKLVSISYLDGFYYKPRLDLETLARHAEGLIAISSSWSGDISTALRNKNNERLAELVDYYKKTFAGDFYIEITRHPELAGHNEHMETLVKFAKENGLQIVSAHDVYYLNPEDAAAKDTLMAVMQGGEAKERTGWGENQEDFSFILPEEMEARFKDLPEALFNNQFEATCNFKT